MVRVEHHAAARLAMARSAVIANAVTDSVVTDSAVIHKEAARHEAIPNATRPRATVPAAAIVALMERLPPHDPLTIAARRDVAPMAAVPRAARTLVHMVIAGMRAVALSPAVVRLAILLTAVQQVARLRLHSRNASLRQRPLCCIAPAESLVAAMVVIPRPVL